MEEKKHRQVTWQCGRRWPQKKTGRPVKMRLSREDDFLVTGKRHPFSHDFKAGFDDDGFDDDGIGVGIGVGLAVRGPAAEFAATCVADKK